MTKKTNIYSRQFSKIDGLQNKDFVDYNLCQTEENDYTVYGIELVSSLEKYSKKQKDSLAKVSSSKEVVLDILKYLYENSVRPKSAYAVVSDVLNFKKITDESVLTII